MAPSSTCRSHRAAPRDRSDRRARFKRVRGRVAVRAPRRGSSLCESGSKSRGSPGTIAKPIYRASSIAKAPIANTRLGTTWPPLRCRRPFCTFSAVRPGGRRHVRVSLDAAGHRRVSGDCPCAATLGSMVPVRPGSTPKPAPSSGADVPQGRHSHGHRAGASGDMGTSHARGPACDEEFRPSLTRPTARVDGEPPGRTRRSRVGRRPASGPRTTSATS